MRRILSLPSIAAACGLAVSVAAHGQCPNFGDCFIPNPTPGCDITSCCLAVCTADFYCCDQEWDDLCAALGQDLCGCGGPNAGSCLVPNFTTGCDSPGCCQSICVLDTYCCEVVWDEFCATAAVELCACGGPGAGSCFEANGTPACTSLACCAAVCAADPFCCETDWDELCAEQGLDACGCGGAGAGECLQPNDTPGCSALACCGVVCAADPFCCDEIWDDLCAVAAADQCTSCGAGASGSCFLANGTPACSLLACCDAVCAADPFCCDSIWDEVCADVAIALFASCGGPVTGSCFEANGTPACVDPICCGGVCVVDPFCCESEWDDLCVDQAVEACSHSACPGPGGCGIGNGTPGCADALCCNIVCQADPFCCDVEWDQFCADDGLNMCIFCPGDTNGDAMIGVVDLVHVLLDWGTDGAEHHGDVNGDGIVNVEDLVDVLHGWGSCP